MVNPHLATCQRRVGLIGPRHQARRDATLVDLVSDDPAAVAPG